MLQHPKHWWQQAVWSDEFKCELWGANKIKWVRRPKNKAYDPRYTAKTIKHGGGSLMLWGNISWKGKGRLVKLEGLQDSEAYTNMLEENLVQSVEEMGLGPRWFFQQVCKNLTFL